MATQALVESRQQLGEQVTEALAADPKIDLRAALWWHDEESGELLFFVSTPIYDTHGPRKAYLQIRRAIKRKSLLPEFPLHSLWAVGAGHPIVKKLGKMLGAEARELLFTSFDADGFSTDYLYLYWLKKTGRRPGQARVIRPVQRRK